VHQTLTRLSLGGRSGFPGWFRSHPKITEPYTPNRRAAGASLRPWEATLHWRTLLWWLALIVFVLAAIFHYSPRLGRHAPALVAAGLALFTLGWLARGDLVGD